MVHFWQITGGIYVAGQCRTCFDLQPHSRVQALLDFLFFSQVENVTLFFICTVFLIYVVKSFLKAKLFVL